MATLVIYTVGGTSYQLDSDQDKKNALAGLVADLHSDGYLLYDANEKTIYIPHHAVTAVHATEDTTMEDPEDYFHAFKDGHRTMCGRDTWTVSTKYDLSEVDCSGCLAAYEELTHAYHPHGQVNEIMCGMDPMSALAATSMDHVDCPVCLNEWEKRPRLNMHLVYDADKE